MAAAWLTADSEKLLAAARHATAAGAAESPPFLFLTPQQAADLDAATSQIIPSDGSPGAHEAHVVYFIDKALATWQKEQRPDFEKGLAELRTRSGSVAFASLPSERQTAIIASLEKDKHPFFSALRGATIVAMFANPEYGGNFNKQGWKMLGFDDRFSWAPPFGWYDANA